jgi:hypothetical protein
VCVRVRVRVRVRVCGTQVLTLARQVHYHSSQSASPFFMLGIFKIGSRELFAWAVLKLRSS